MVCSPANKVIATNGTPRQILAAMVENRAFQGSPRKSMYAVMKPIFTKAQLMMENCESKSHQNAIADKAVGTM